MHRHMGQLLDSHQQRFREAVTKEVEEAQRLHESTQHFQQGLKAYAASKPWEATDVTVTRDPSGGSGSQGAGAEGDWALYRWVQEPDGAVLLYVEVPSTWAAGPSAVTASHIACEVKEDSVAVAVSLPCAKATAAGVERGRESRCLWRGALHGSVLPLESTWCYGEAPLRACVF